MNNGIKANLADLALYFGTSYCDILVSDDGSDICVSAGGSPVYGYLDIARVTKGSIVEDKIKVKDYIAYSYSDLDLALNYYQGEEPENKDYGYDNG